MNAGRMFLVVARGIHGFLVFSLLCGVAVGARGYFSDPESGRRYLPGLFFYVLTLVLYLALARLSARLTRSYGDDR